MRTFTAYFSGTVVSLAGVLVGAWWAPFTVGLVIGLLLARARVAILAGTVTGLLAWAAPLLGIHLKLNLGPSAESLAAIMGFAHAPAIPVVLTCAVGLLLGLTGAWLGSAARGLAGRDQPAISR